MYACGVAHDWCWYEFKCRFVFRQCSASAELVHAANVVLNMNSCLAYNVDNMQTYGIVIHGVTLWQDTVGNIEFNDIRIQTLRAGCIAL